MQRGHATTRLFESIALRDTLALVRHTSRKRQSPDPLARVDGPTWLVVRDRVGRVLESTELVRKTDLRAVLNAAREERVAGGWTAGPIGAVCAFFFASRNGERVLVGIEHIPPRNRLYL